MRIGSAFVIPAALFVSACGGGQTEATEAEEALSNDLQPAAPSPGTVAPEGGAGNHMNGADSAPAAGNSQ